MPRVSVLIPIYNASVYIMRSIESVLSQGYSDMEIVIVNDGSTDDSEAVLKKYLNDKRIKYIKTENRGVSHALNRGLGSASGDYVSFLHADDAFRPGKIKKQLSLMERFPEFGVSYAAESYFLEDTAKGAKENTAKNAKSPYFHFSGDIFYFLKRNNFIHVSTVMMRKEIFKDIRFDEGLACHEDWDVFLRLSRKGVKFLYVNEILADISVHSRNLSADSAIMDATRSDVGKRAKRLWKEFKSDINFYSPKGIIALKRYLVFKARAFVVGFPACSKFQAKSPRDILST